MLLVRSLHMAPGYLVRSTIRCLFKKYCNNKELSWMAQGNNFKVVILGEGCVGKTCILLRYVEDKFNEQHVKTGKADFLTKKLNIKGKRVVLSLWDTAGQEEYRALAPMYYRGCNGAILVYDITDEDSFRKVTNWVKELRRSVSGEVPLCIVGNKIDLEKRRNVPLQTAEEFAASVGAQHFETSAKHNRGLNELFFDLGRRMQANAEARNALHGDCRAAQREPILVVDDSASQKKGCC